MTVLDRFMAKVEKTETCWIWKGARNRHGYGKISVGGQPRLAHRVAYGLLVGPIADGLELDHLCRTPACVNPDHLEAVAHRTNILRGVSLNAQRAAQTHCIRGHALEGDNLDPAALAKRGHRHCLTCRRERDRERHHRNQADPAYRAYKAANARASYQRRRSVAA